MALVLRCILFIASVGVDLLDSLLFTSLMPFAVRVRVREKEEEFFLIQKLYFIRK